MIHHWYVKEGKQRFIGVISPFTIKDALHNVKVYFVCPQFSLLAAKAHAARSMGESRRDLTKKVKHTIGSEWSIMVDVAFTRKATHGEVVLHMPGRTIYCSIFHTNNTEAEEAIQKMIEGRPGIPVQMFDRDEPGLCGHAYLLPEENKGHKYWGLNTWTASRGSVCCITLYFHSFEDFNWAIGVWKSARHARETKSRLN